MTAPSERSAERDAALQAMLPNVAFDGWTERSLRAGLRAIGADPEEAGFLFPDGPADMVEAFCDWADRRMEAAAAELTLTRLPERVRAIIALRLEQNRRYREAVRRAVAVLALPRNARVAARCTARTVDSIWHAAGDRSTDFSWYTKRAILTATYGATLLFWLRDTSEHDAATLAFLDRRLAGIAWTHRMRRRLEGALERVTPAALRERMAR
jgi:ubiquinone biosynthesis protein COQ9